MKAIQVIFNVRLLITQSVGIPEFLEKNTRMSFFSENQNIQYLRYIVHVRSRLTAKEDFCSKISLFILKINVSDITW